MWTNDVRYLEAKSNPVADALSRPPDVPLGAAYDIPVDGPLVDVNDVLAAVDAPIDAVALETVDHIQMSKDQRQCPEVIAHKQGQHPKGLNLQYVEFTPQVFLYC